MPVLAQAAGADPTSASMWASVIQQVPALALFVAFAYIVFRYLEKKTAQDQQYASEKDRMDREHLAAIASNVMQALEQHDAAFLAAMKEGQERNREERIQREAASREIAKECHATQADSVAAMRDMLKATERLASVASQLDKTAERLERLSARAAA